MNIIIYLFLSNLDPYIFQSWSLVNDERSGKLQRANIYSVDKDKLELEIDDHGMLFDNIKQFRKEGKEREIYTY